MPIYLVTTLAKWDEPQDQIVGATKRNYCAPSRRRPNPFPADLSCDGNVPGGSALFSPSVAIDRTQSRFISVIKKKEHRRLPFEFVYPSLGHYLWKKGNRSSLVYAVFNSKNAINARTEFLYSFFLRKFSLVLTTRLDGASSCELCAQKEVRVLFLQGKSAIFGHKSLVFCGDVNEYGWQMVGQRFFRSRESGSCQIHQMWTFAIFIFVAFWYGLFLFTLILRWFLISLKS